jgi:hypothetical protein
MLTQLYCSCNYVCHFSFTYLEVVLALDYYLIIDEMMFAFLDFIGLKGQSNRRLISLEELKQHKGGDCVWTVLKGRVYNIAPYMKFHPGGSHSFSLCRVILFEFQNHCSHLTSHNLFCITLCIMAHFPNLYHVLG